MTNFRVDVPVAMQGQAPKIQEVFLALSEEDHSCSASFGLQIHIQSSL